MITIIDTPSSVLLFLFLSDIDGLGSSAIGGQLIRRASSKSPLSCDKAGSDTVMAGQYHKSAPKPQKYVGLIDDSLSELFISSFNRISDFFNGLICRFFLLQL